MAARADESQNAVGVAPHLPLALVDSMMVMVAQRHQIGQIGWSLVGPVHDVVDVGEDVVGAAGEAASPIAPLDLAPLRRGGESLGPTLEHGVTEGIIEGQGHRGVAGDPPDGFAAQETQPLDLGSAGAALQKGKIGMGHDEEVRPGPAGSA